MSIKVYKVFKILLRKKKENLKMEQYTMFMDWVTNSPPDDVCNLNFSDVN
jgi:hypothetical protein